MGIGLPGSIAFNIRWEPSEDEFRKSRFIRSRGEAFAWAVKSSNIACVIIMLHPLDSIANLFLIC
jgi:hypothetical protein